MTKRNRRRKAEEARAPSNGATAAAVPAVPEPEPEPEPEPAASPQPVVRVAKPEPKTPRNNAMARSKQSYTTKPELDMEELADRMTVHPQASVSIEVVDAKGHPASVPGATDLLIDTGNLPDLPSVLSRVVMPGRYRVKAYDPFDKKNFVVTPYFIRIAAPPIRAGSGGDEDLPAFATMGMEADMGTGGWQGDLVNHLQSQMQQRSTSPGRVGPPVPGGAGSYNYPGPGGAAFPGARFTSDTIAMRQATKYEREVDDLRKKFDATVENHRREVEQLRKEREEDRRRYDEDRRRIEQEKFEARIEARMAAMQPRDNGAQWAQLAAALVPLGTAFITSGKDRDIESQRMQSRMMELQVTTLQHRPDALGSLKELVMGLAPLIAPFLTQWWNSKSPESQAALVNTMTENQLNTIAMMAQLVEALAGDPDNKPWWLEPIKQTINQALALGSSYVKALGQDSAQRRLPTFAPQPAPQQIAQAAPAPVPATAPTQPVAASPASPSASAAEEPIPPSDLEVLKSLSSEQLVELLMAQPAVPEEFKSREWQHILRKVHDRVDPDEIVQLLLGHLENLERFDALPEAISLVFEHPRETMTGFIGSLPITSIDPAYADRLHAVIVAAIEQLNAAQDEDAEDTQLPAVPQPAQTPAGYTTVS